MSSNAWSSSNATLFDCVLSGIRFCSVTVGEAFTAAGVLSISFPLQSELPKEIIHIIRSTLLVNMLIMMCLLINRLMIMARKYSAVRCSCEGRYGCLLIVSKSNIWIYEASFPVEYHVDHLMIGPNDHKMQLINNLSDHHLLRK